jgi:hypothetical protein
MLLPFDSLIHSLFPNQLSNHIILLELTIPLLSFLGGKVQFISANV